MNSSSNTLVPERLKTARETLNLSKAEAARRIGLTAASYVRYEAGDRSPGNGGMLFLVSVCQFSCVFRYLDQAEHHGILKNLIF